MIRLFSLACALSLLACTSSGSMSSGDDQPDPTPDGGGSSTQTLDPVDCTAFAQSFANAATACGSALPSGGQGMIESWCKAGIRDAAMCGGAPAAGLDCFATPDADDWTCGGGDPLPACGGDIQAALGAFCLVALGNPACGSIACEYDADCASGASCNGVTGMCFQDSAYCVGMPCQYDADCPSNEKCNSAEGACIMQ